MNELLRTYDLEGLISSGAPDDEYEPEVEHIMEELEKIPSGQATKDMIVAIFEDVWKRMFGATESRLQRIRPEFSEIADKLLTYFR
jgi:hypothetical protein